MALTLTLETYYPLTFATTIPALPLGFDAGMVLEVFQTKVHPDMSLLHHIPIRFFARTTLSDYVAYAMAAVSTLICPGASLTSHPLWLTANNLLSLALELDNREARNVELINAVNISITYSL